MQRHYQLVGIASKIREQNLRASYEVHENIRMLIKKTTIGAIVVVGTVVLTYATVTFGFPAFFQLLIESGFIQNPAMAHTFASLLEVPYTFTADQIKLLSQAFTALQNLNPDEYKTLLGLLKPSLTSTNFFSNLILNKDGIETSINALSATPESITKLKAAFDGIINIQAYIVANLFEPEKAQLFLQKLSTMPTDLTQLMDSITEASDILRKLNFVFRGAKFAFDFQTAEDAQQFKRDILSFPFVSLIKSQFGMRRLAEGALPRIEEVEGLIAPYILSARDQVAPYVKTMSFGTIALPLADGKEIFSKVSRENLSIMLSQMMMGAGEQTVNLLVSKVIYDKPKKEELVAKGNDDKDNSPKSKLRRELLTKGLKGDDLIKILENEFPTIDKQINQEAKDSSMGTAEFLLSCGKGALDDIYKSTGKNLKANTSGVLVLGGIGATMAAVFSDQISLAAMTNQYLFRCVYPILYTIQLIITNKYATPLINALKIDLTTAFTNLVKRIGKKIATHFKRNNLSALAMKIPKVDKFSKFVILNHFSEFLLMICQFLDTVPAVLFDVFVVGGTNQVISQTLQNQSVSILNCMRGLSIETFFETVTDAHRWFSNLTLSREQAAESFFTFALHRISGNIANSVQATNTVLYRPVELTTQPFPSFSDPKFLENVWKSIISNIENAFPEIMNFAGRLALIMSGSAQHVPSSLIKPNYGRSGVLLRAGDVTFVAEDANGEIEETLQAQQIFMNMLLSAIVQGGNTDFVNMTDAQLETAVHLTQPDVDAKKYAQLIRNAIAELTPGPPPTWIAKTIGAPPITLAQAAEKLMRETFEQVIREEMIGRTGLDAIIDGLKGKSLFEFINAPEFKDMNLSRLEKMHTKALTKAVTGLTNLLFPRNAETIINRYGIKTPEKSYFWTSENGEYKQKITINASVTDPDSLEVDLKAIDSFTETNLLDPKKKKLKELFSKEPRGPLREMAEELIMYGQTISIKDLSSISAEERRRKELDWVIARRELQTIENDPTKSQAEKLAAKLKEQQAKDALDMTAPNNNVFKNITVIGPNDLMIIDEWVQEFKKLLKNENITMYDAFNESDASDLDSFMAHKVGKSVRLFSSLFGNIATWIGYHDVSLLSPQDKADVTSFLLGLHIINDENQLNEVLKSNPEAARSIRDYEVRRRKLERAQKRFERNAKYNLGKIPSIISLLNIDEIPLGVWEHLRKELGLQTNQTFNYDKDKIDKDPRAELVRLFNGQDDNERRKDCLRELLYLYNIPTKDNNFAGLRDDWAIHITLTDEQCRAEIEKDALKKWCEKKNNCDEALSEPKLPMSLHDKVKMFFEI
jgi:hypothetical protein